MLFILLPFCVKGQQIITIAGRESSGYSGDGGMATLAKLNIPDAVIFDTCGNLYIADGSNFRIRKVSCDNIITTVAGNGVAGYDGDNLPATATRIDLPQALAVDKYGRIYYTDWVRDRVRVIDTNGFIQTIAGNGLRGYSGDGGLATNAMITNPQGIYISEDMNVYFSDAGCRGIRKVDPSGNISTFAGTGVLGYSGDGGPATNATFTAALGIAKDMFGSIIFSDFNNHCIRKISTTGIVTTIAGTGIDGYSGDGGPATLATLRSPSGITIDRAGNIYFAEYNNNIIRKINTYGYISTVAGIGVTGYGGDGGPATSARLFYPGGICFDSCENLFIADQQNSRIRKIVFDTVCVKHCSSLTLGLNDTEPGNLSIYPNPTTNLLHITGLPGAATYRLLSMVGAVALCGELPAGGGAAPLQGLPPGMYVLELVTERGERVVRSVVKE